MTVRNVLTWVVLVTASGCTFALTDPQSIAGEYRLMSVDGAELPCCARTDSAGTRVTVVGGALTLGEAAPDTYVYTPAGMPMPRSCVHEIPNGAKVGRDGWVTRPDGSRYRLPVCGDGDYSMVVIWRHERADGTADTVSETTSGKYSWGSDPVTGGMVTLVEASGLGRITESGGGVGIELQMGVRVGSASPQGPRYQFHQVAR